MSRKSKRRAEKLGPRLPAAEQLLIDELPQIAERKILCTSLGRAQFATTAAQTFPDARVVCHYLDIYQADAAQAAMRETGLTSGAGERLEVVCSPDFPLSEFDVVALPVDPRGDSELTRDLLQSAHDRLPLGGRMICATSNEEDQWLHDELRKMFPKVTRRPGSTGVLYLATKTEPLKKHKNYDCEFAFRDRERLIKAVSRPGVFSHRSLDSGARALINTMEVRPGDRVLDLGCGSGVVSLAAAFRGEGVQVTALDSHARAIECTQRSAELNELTNITARLDADGETETPGTFDLALGNPPYFSDYTIAEIFLQGARRALKPGGKVLMVTKSPTWFEERMPDLFDDVERLTHKAYFVVAGRQP